ncbi:1-acyl-sn-glycerol-3-phosphate acyltransferase [Neolewinella lacunae]|uniref:1-acyl-sn-glycerol-3-phosphate acyltransferase n=1 Tax=Neolewinella lacunae TaxID=1517758 RepID=A0A923PF20_9BACT|nr:1-acyl-sn-glycerol-3-phosphate acyltransferase [Neolewinella lacunae]MBC6992882.1 1-acyl-sn-glycerol-3-phosphate acyltransferase [Neolewinella lacunae]MDN3633754.1 1-acyl-sn-glycerol-3-phosphate acyltransferase [Neolewinella lacunae]
MLYHLVRPVARYVLRHYYRNIDLTGLEQIPPGAAVILAANHPTAFIEPCILACFQPRTLWFLARGNLFKNGIFTFLLNALNILPVFRREDGGYEKLKVNFSTFDACYRALSRGRALMILAEGRTIHEKDLRPLRKGTARIALGALDKYNTLPEVYIVPVGINFTHADRIRSTVMLRCGEPILASEYLAAYRENEAIAIRDLTLHLRQRLEPLVVRYPSRLHADLGEAELELDRSNHATHLRHGITHFGDQLNRELALASEAPAAAPALSRYFHRLATNGLTDAALAGNYRKDRQMPATEWAKSLLAGLLLLPQIPLWLLAEAIAASQPKHIEFYSPVRFAVVAGGTFLLYPLALLLLPWLGKAWLLASLLSVGWAIRKLERLQRWYANRKVERMVEQERSILRDWRKALE